VRPFVANFFDCLIVFVLFKENRLKYIIINHGKQSLRVENINQEQIKARQSIRLPFNVVTNFPPVCNITPFVKVLRRYSALFSIVSMFIIITITTPVSLC
jgi:hypothetical protein